MAHSDPVFVGTATYLYQKPTPKNGWRILLPGLDIHTCLGTVETVYGDILLSHPDFGLILWQPLVIIEDEG